MTKFQTSSNKSSLINFPNIRPSLDLDFANSKSLDPRITFTRSSSGSYVGPDGLIKYAGVNQPRFDHDPTTGESLGLLIEESRTNLLLRSEKFDDASWNKSSSSVSPNSVISPDDNITSDKLILNPNVDAGFLRQTNSFTRNLTYTFSCFAKSSGAFNFRLFFPSTAFGSNLDARFNLTTGTITSFSTTSASIQNIGNGWYRCSITATATSTVSSSIQIEANYTGDGTSGIYIWGAQLEEGAFPTSYIPTTTSTRTRAADNASMTGTKFSSWYNQSEGTFYSTVKSTTSGYIISARSLSIGGRDRHQLTQTGGATVVSNVITATFPNTYKNQTKQAYRYSTNNFSFVSDKDRISQKFSGSIPTNISYATIGRADFGLILTLNGTISRLTYYPKRLPNSQLQALTK